MRLHHGARREVRRERERQAQRRRELGAEQARPEDPDRHVEPGPGYGLHALARLRRLEIALQLDDVLREAVGVADQGRAAARGRRPDRAPGARPRPRSIRPGNSDSSVPNCSAMTSGAWFGSMMPPAPTRIVDVPGADVARSAPPSPRSRCRACCGARPASSAGNPSARRAAPAPGCCDRTGRRRRPRRSARDREPRTELSVPDLPLPRGSPLSTEQPPLPARNGHGCVGCRVGLDDQLRGTDRWPTRSVS